MIEHLCIQEISLQYDVKIAVVSIMKTVVDNVPQSEAKRECEWSKRTCAVAATS